MIKIAENKTVAEAVKLLQEKPEERVATIYGDKSNGSFWGIHISTEGNHIYGKYINRCLITFENETAIGLERYIHRAVFTDSIIAGDEYFWSVYEQD